MKSKKKGFTLIELITVLAISGILITISTGWYITNVVSAGNKNNKNVDLQSGVSTSIEMIKNTLRKSTQVHLVGKNVYDPDLTIQQLEARGLDTNYNYIAIYKDPVTNEKILANLVYSRAESKFNVIPIVASDKQDQLNRNVVSYSMEFFKGEPDYNKKLNNKIINISVKGIAKDLDESGHATSPENNKTFELSEDIFLPNSNQILISKFFSGDIEDVTAIAYDSSRIAGEKTTKKFDSMTFVFVIDTSGSMRWDMTLSTGAKESRLDVAKKSIKSFYESLDKLAKDNDIVIKAYMFDYNYRTAFFITDLNEDKTHFDYIYNVDVLKSKGYGIYEMGKNKNGKDELITKTEALVADSATNTGEAILQGLEILNQAKDAKSTGEKRFLVLLTDGQPNTIVISGPRKPKIKIGDYSYYQYDNPNSFLCSIADYRRFYSTRNNPTSGSTHSNFVTYGQNMHFGGGNGTTLAMQYIDRVTRPANQVNRDDTFDKAYLIGFSDSHSDKKRLGISDITAIPPAESIRFFMSRTTAGDNKKMNKVQTFDASNEVSLNSAFEGITEDIGRVMGVFDGPNKLR